MNRQLRTLGYISLWRGERAHGRGAGRARSLLVTSSAEVACEAMQHKSLPWAARCSYVFTMTYAACRSCPTLQRAPQTRDCGATPLMPSPAWAQKTIHSQIVLMGEMAGRGAPLASLSPALRQTRARMVTLGDASTSGQSRVGAPLAAWWNGSAWHCSCDGWLMHALAYSYVGYCSGATQEQDSKQSMAGGLEMLHSRTACCVTPGGVLVW